MGLLWIFMGYSRAYSVFAGGAEVLAGAFLFFRRTTTLGALLAAAVMANVVMLNFCYDVPVKLNSTHYLAICLFLLAPDVRRLAGVLVFHRAVEAASIAWPPMKPWARRTRIAVKAAVLSLVVYKTVQHTRRGLAFRSRPATSTIAGAYDVEEFQSLGDPRIAAWRSFSVSRRGFAQVGRADGSRSRYAVKEDGEKGTLTLSARQDGPPLWIMFVRREGDALTLEGTLEEAAIRVRLRRIDETKWLLVTRGFHWVSETPYNP
jgi:hypothetical protein